MSCISGSFLCLIPNKNILEQPSFWIEDLFYRFMAAIPIMIGQNLLRAEYWSNLMFEKRGLSYLILVGTGFVLYACIMTGYSYLWIFHYGYNPPIPLNLHVGGSLTLIGINIALWFRSVYLLFDFCNAATNNIFSLFFPDCLKPQGTWMASRKGMPGTSAKSWLYF